MFIANKTKKYPCTGYYPSPSGIDVRFPGVEGVTLPLTGSITLVSEDNNRILAIQDCADYVRQTFENGVLTLTNEPEPAAPTVETVRAAKFSALDGSCSGAIHGGLTLGGKHYSLTATAQSNLKAAQDKARAGFTIIPYSADGEELTAYSAEAILAIAQAADEWGTVNIVYYGKLKRWIAREADKSVIEGIHYGSMLPDDLMQEMGTTLAGFGINIKDYAAMLTA